jgi:putative transposase
VLGAGTARAVARRVTVPRRIVPGTTYLLTRRCTQRQFLLKPTALANLILEFVLAVAAARYGVLIHAVCALSDHLHIVVTDPHGRLPEFGHLLHGVVAKAVGSLHGHWENFWAPSSYSAVTLVTREDIVEKVAYTLANPASAGLVERGGQWPGLWSDPRSMGGPGEVIPRPGHYFSEEGSMPRSEVLVYSVPPGFESEEEFRALVTQRVHQLEMAAAADRADRGVSVMGARRVMKQKPTDRPAPGEPRRGLNPRIACRNTWKRIEALQRLVGFLDDYRDALRRFASSGATRKPSSRTAPISCASGSASPARAAERRAT